MISENIHIDPPHSNNVKKWFDDTIANLRYDQTLLENDIIEKDKKKFYELLMSNNQEVMNSLARQSSSVFFISGLLDFYLKELLKAQSKPKKLAFELSDSKILVWAEIFQNDEVMENSLILSEAKTNAHFSQFGFHISSTIVEDSDCLPIPLHYKDVPIINN